jgi:hypothetical protein
MRFIFTAETLNKKLIFFFIGFAALAFSSGIYSYNGHSEWPPIKMQGEGYYSYLPTLIISKSIDFTFVEKNRFKDGFPGRTGIRLNKKTGKLDNQYPMGTAILIGPFFLIAHFLSLLFNSVNADGYSLIYQLSILMAACFYYSLGTFVLAKYLNQFFNERVVFITIIFITFGTSLFHYATFDSIFPHIYSYCFVSLLLYFTEKFWRDQTLISSLVLGSIIGMLFLINGLNLVLVSFFFLFPYGIGFKKIILSNTKLLLCAIGTAFVIIVPQCIIWKVNAGSFFAGFHFTQSPEGETFNWFSPKLIEIVSSIQAGVFIWSPILALGLIGLLLCLKGTLKKIAVLSLINIGVLTYLMASLKDWHLDGGYGHRGFVDIYPFFAIGIAAFLNEFKKTVTLKTVTVILGVFALLTSIQMFNFWKGKIDYLNPTWEQYVRALKNFPRLVLVELLPQSMKSLTANEGLFAKGAIIIPDQKEIEVRAEGTFIIKVMIKNKGYSYWLPPKRNGDIHGAVALGGQWYPKELLKACKRPGFSPVLESRIKLWDIAPPNEWVHFEDFIKVPAEPGNYYYMLGLVSEKVTWFDQVSNSFLKCIEVKVRPKSDKFRSFFPRGLKEMNH